MAAEIPNRPKFLKKDFKNRSKKSFRILKAYLSVVKSLSRDDEFRKMFELSVAKSLSRDDEFRKMFEQEAIQNDETEAFIYELPNANDFKNRFLKSYRNAAKLFSSNDEEFKMFEQAIQNSSPDLLPLYSYNVTEAFISNYLLVIDHALNSSHDMLIDDVLNRK
jgi:hypothetical protein